MRIGIAGIGGRMGRVLAEEAARAASLVGGIDREDVATPEGTARFPGIAALRQH